MKPIPGTKAASESADAGPALLAELGPGTRLAEATKRLEVSGIRRASQIPGTWVYEVRLIKELDQRQRLALIHDQQERIVTAALIIDFQDVGNLDSDFQTFAKVRDTLMKAFGRPYSFYERGDFDASFAVAVNTSRFVRLFEWRTGKGMLRFGIPRRLDGVVRMEIQHGRKFPTPGITLWSVETAR